MSSKISEGTSETHLKLWPELNECDSFPLLFNHTQYTLTHTCNRESFDYSELLLVITIEFFGLKGKNSHSSQKGNIAALMVNFS